MINPKRLQVTFGDDDEQCPGKNSTETLRDSVARSLTDVFQSKFSSENFQETIGGVLSKYGRIIRTGTKDSRNSRILHLACQSGPWTALTMDDLADICTGILMREFHDAYWSRRERIVRTISERAPQHLEEVLAFTDRLITTFKKALVSTTAGSSTFLRACKNATPKMPDFDKIKQNERDVFALNGQVYQIKAGGNEISPISGEDTTAHCQDCEMTIEGFEGLKASEIQPVELCGINAETISALRVILAAGLMMNRIEKNTVLLITGPHAESFATLIQSLAGPYGRAPPLPTISASSSLTIAQVVCSHITRLSFFPAAGKKMLSRALYRLSEYKGANTLPIVVSPLDLFPLVLPHDWRVIHIDLGGIPLTKRTEPHELFQWLIGGIQNGSQLVPKVQGLPTIASMKKDAISAAFQRLAKNKHWCAKEQEEPSLESIESVHVSLLSHLIQPVKEAAKELGYQSLPVDQLSLALVLESLQYHVTKSKNVFRVELFTAIPPAD